MVKEIHLIDKPKSTHGGAGRGQGVKSVDGATGLKRRNISIDDKRRDILRDIGDGDLSLGIRRAADRINSGSKSTSD